MKNNNEYLVIIIKKHWRISKQFFINAYYILFKSDSFSFDPKSFRLIYYDTIGFISGSKKKIKSHNEIIINLINW